MVLGQYFHGIYKDFRIWHSKLTKIDFCWQTFITKDTFRAGKFSGSTFEKRTPGRKWGMFVLHVGMDDCTIGTKFLRVSSRCKGGCEKSCLWTYDKAWAPVTLHLRVYWVEEPLYPDGASWYKDIQVCAVYESAGKADLSKSYWN